MVQQHLAGVVELLLPGRVALLLEAYDSLYLELHRRQRVLDFVRHLPRHSVPGLVALGLCKLARALLQLVHHTVVGIHQRGNLIAARVSDFLQLALARAAHSAAHKAQRPEHPVHHRRLRQPRKQEEQQEHGKDGHRMVHGVALEVVALLHIRRAEHCHYIAVRPEQRHIHSMVVPPAERLLADKVALVQRHNLLERLFVYAVAHQHTFKRFRVGAQYDTAAGRIHGNVRAGVVADRLDQRSQLGRVLQVLDIYAAQAVLGKHLDSVDTVRHNRHLVGLVAAVHEEHADACHHHQCEQQRRGQGQGDARTEVIVLRGPEITLARLEPHKQQPHNQRGEHAFHHIAEHANLPARNNDSLLVRNHIDEVHEAVAHVVAHAITIHRIVHPVIHTGGIGILSLEKPQVAVLVAGIGIGGWHACTSGRYYAQQARVALAVGQVLLRDFDEQVRHAAGRMEISEDAVVARRALGSARAKEERAVGNRLPFGRDAGEVGDSLLRRHAGTDDMYTHRVVLRFSQQIVVYNAVTYDDLAPVHESESRNHVVFRNGPLDFQQLQLKGDIPVHRQLPGPDLYPVLLLLEPQHGKSHHEICSREHREDEARGGGEEIHPASEHLRKRRLKHLQQHRHHGQQRQERQIHHERESRQAAELVELQRDVRVVDDIAQGQVHIDQQHQHQHDVQQRHKTRDAAHFDALPQAPAHQIHHDDAKQHGEVEQQHGTQREQQRAAGIDHRRED